MGNSRYGYGWIFNHQDHSGSSEQMGVQDLLIEQVEEVMAVRLWEEAGK